MVLYIVSALYLQAVYTYSSSIAFQIPNYNPSLDRHRKSKLWIYVYKGIKRRQILEETGNRLD